MTYEVVIEERRRYVILADGPDVKIAEDDALLRYHRMAKRGELVPHDTEKPVIRSIERLK